MFQLLFFIGWIGIFCGSVSGIYFIIRPEDFPLEPGNLDFNIVMYSVAIFYLILSIEKFVSIFGKGVEKAYTFKLKSGKIVITYQAIDRIIKGIIFEKSFIRESKIKITPTKTGVKLKIKLVCEERENLSGEISKMQEEIIKNLEVITAVKAESAEIIITDVIAKETISTEGE